jgi:hypothetical protein
VSWFELLTYYSAYGLAVYLVYDLGKIFWIPLLLDLLFDLSLSLGLLSGFDSRPLALTYEFLFFVWVLVLGGKLTNATFVAALLVDLGVIFNGIWQPIQMAGTGPEFWNTMSTTIMNVWMASTFVVVLSVVVQSTVIAKLRGRYVDILTNPKKRFLLPIGAHTALWLLPTYGKGYLPDFFIENGYRIAAYTLVWGWVAVEFPFYLMYRRMRKRYG